MNPPQPDINVGHTNFIAEAAAWTEAQSERAAQLPEHLSKNNIKTVRVVYSDQHGLMRGKALSTENFLLSLRNGVAETVANLGKDTANIPVVPLFNRDGGFGIEQMGGGGDMLLVPDPVTLKILPWAPDTAWIISDLYLKDRTRCPFDCRQLMRNALAALGEQAFDYIAGLELEFYVFAIEDEKLALGESGQPPAPPAVKAISHGFQYHAEHPMDRVAHVADMIRDMAAGLELPLRTIEAEWGPGQFEVTFNPLNGLAAADSLLLFRVRGQAPDAAPRPAGQLHGEACAAQRVFERVAPAPVVAEQGNRGECVCWRWEPVERYRVSLHRRAAGTRRGADRVFQPDHQRL